MEVRFPVPCRSGSTPFCARTTGFPVNKACRIMLPARLSAISSDSLERVFTLSIGTTTAPILQGAQPLRFVNADYMREAFELLPHAVGRRAVRLRAKKPIARGSPAERATDLLYAWLKPTVAPLNTTITVPVRRPHRVQGKQSLQYFATTVNLLSSEIVTQSRIRTRFAVSCLTLQLFPRS